MAKLKNEIERLKSRHNHAEERITNLYGGLYKVIHSEEQIEKNEKRLKKVYLTYEI